MRCVIIGGAEIRNYPLIRSYLREDDYMIFCDCGLKHSDDLGVSPSLVIGDFDSHPMPENSRNVIKLPVMKDDTDTIFAVKEGIRRGYEDFCAALDKVLNLTADEVDTRSNEHLAYDAIHFALLSYASSLACSRYVALLREQKEAEQTAQPKKAKKEND